MSALNAIDSAIEILIEDGAHHRIPERENDQLHNLREARASVAELLAALADFDGMGYPCSGATPRLARLRSAYRAVRGDA